MFTRQTVSGFGQLIEGELPRGQMVLGKSEVAGPVIFVEIDDGEPSAAPNGVRCTGEVLRAVFNMVVGITEEQEID